MKKQIIYSMLAVSMLTASCSNEDFLEEVKEHNQVSFVIGGTVSRTTTTGNTTTFEVGDKIALSSTGLESDMKNAIFNVGEGSTLTGGSFFYKDENEATFYAHYPTTATYNTTSVTMNVASDQSSSEKFNANDFMTATAKGKAATNEGKVSLNFKHRLAFVKVVLQQPESAPTEAVTTTDPLSTVSSVSLSGIKPVATWTLASDEVVTSGDATTIKMWKQAGQEYWAVLPIQTITNGTDLVSVIDGDKKYVYTLSSDLTFSESKAKKITLSLVSGKLKATFTDLTIEDWVDDPDVVEGDAGEVEQPALKIVDSAKAVTLTPNSKDKAVAGKWNVAVDAGNTIVMDDSEKAIHFNIAAENSAHNPSTWWNNAVYYRPSEFVAGQIKPKLYKLTFDIKAGVADKGFLVQVMKGEEKTNTYFGIVNTDPTKPDAKATFTRMYYPSFKEADKYISMTYWVDFSKIIDASGKNTTEGKVGDYSKVLLTLSINTGSTAANAFGVDFYVKNISFVEVK